MCNRTLMNVAAALLIGPASMLVGCQGDVVARGGESEAVAPETPSTALADPVEVLSNTSGDSAALKDIGVMLIRTQGDYDALGDADIAPNVDFDTSDLVILALGERPTGGYSVKITGVQLQGDELAVTGKASAPGPDAITTQALTYPFDAVVIPNTEATSVFHYID